MWAIDIMMKWIRNGGTCICMEGKWKIYKGRGTLSLFHPLNLLWWVRLNPIYQSCIKVTLVKTFACSLSEKQGLAGSEKLGWVFSFSKRQLCNFCNCSTGAAGPGNSLLGKFSPPPPLLRSWVRVKNIFSFSIFIEAPMPCCRKNLIVLTWNFT